jgi:hypothetical protein
MGYGDAARLQSISTITPQHVFRAFELAKRRSWYHPENFNVEQYHTHCKVEKGDMNWVIPG